jgi:hypothetical protein
MAEGVHGDQGADDLAAGAVDALAVALFADGLEMGAQLSCVEAEGAFFAVHEVAGGAAIRHCIGGGDESQGGNQDFVAGFDAGQCQGDVQGGGSVDYSHGMSCPGEGCQIGLEAIHEFANGGNKGAVQAFLQIGPFVPGKTRFVQGHRA